MLKKRIMTGVILAPLVVAAILLLPSDVFIFVLAAFFAIGAYEWSRLAGLLSNISRSLYVLIMLALMFSLYHFHEAWMLSQWLYWLGLLWWICVLVWVVRYQPEDKPAPSSMWISKLTMGAVTLIPAFLALYEIRCSNELGPLMLLYTLMLVWVADSGAYFAGKQFGRHKLAPMLSPSKTIEGVLGGLLSVIIFAFLASISGFISVPNVLGFMVLSVLVACFSIVGDLFESLLKRQANVKDSGTLLPGHGGMLDRIDSLLASAPLLLLGFGILSTY